MNTTLRDVLNVLFKYSRYLLIFTVAALLVCGIYLLGAKKIYASKAKLLVRLGTEQTGSMQFLAGKSNVYITRREQELKNELEILQSDQVANAAARKLLGDAAGDSELLAGVQGYIAENLKVETLYDSDTLELTFNFPDPEAAQLILRLVVDNYIKHHIDVFRDIKEVSFLNDEMTDSRSRYEKLLNEFSQFKQSYKIYNDSAQVTLLIEKKDKLNQTLIDCRADNEYHTEKLKRMKELQKMLSPMQTFATVEVRNKHREDLRSKLGEAEIERQNLLTRYKPASRFVADINREVEMINKLIGGEPERVLDQKDERRNQIYETVQQNILDLESEINGEKAKRTFLETQLQGLEGELDRYAANIKDFIMLKTNVDFAQKAYEKVFDGYMESKLKSLTGENQISNIAVVERPSLSMTPAKPKRKLVLALAGCMVFGGCLVLLCFFSLLDNTITNPNEIAKNFNLPLIGVMPHINPQEISFSQEYFQHVYMLYKKDFQKIYTNLLLRGDREKVYLVTKSQAGEGATTIGLNLAFFLTACQGQKSAFVNFSSDKIFKGQQLSDSALDERFQEGVMAGVAVFQYMPSSSSNSHLTDDQYRIIDRLKQDYEWVFVNIPAVVDSPELLFLSRHLNKAILFVEANKTKTHVVRFNVDVLNRFGFQDVSVLLNKRRFFIPSVLYKL